MIQHTPILRISIAFARTFAPIYGARTLVPRLPACASRTTHVIVCSVIVTIQRQGCLFLHEYSSLILTFIVGEARPPYGSISFEEISYNRSKGFVIAELRKMNHYLPSPIRNDRVFHVVASEDTVFKIDRHAPTLSGGRKVLEVILGIIPHNITFRLKAPSVASTHECTSIEVLNREKPIRSIGK